MCWQLAVVFPVQVHFTWISSPTYPDPLIWLNSYKEEYLGLVNQQTFDIINQDEYHHIINTMGKTAIPSRCILNIKKDAYGCPSQAVSSILYSW